VLVGREDGGDRPAVVVDLLLLAAHNVVQTSHGVQTSIPLSNDHTRSPQQTM
jgi:hypothetical protein